MNTLLVTILVSMVAFSAASSGTVVVGPSGVVTDKGAIGPPGSELGHEWGLGGGLEAGLGLGGHSGVIIAPVAAYHDIHSVNGAAFTAGGGSIGVSAHGASIQGPKTVPVVIAGPSGKITADGLWGPTSNVGQTYGHGW